MWVRVIIPQRFIHTFCHRFEITSESDKSNENLLKPVRMSSKPKSMANGIYNEPVVKPSRVKSIVNYRSDKPEIPKIIKPRRDIKGQDESLESAGNVN